MERRYIFILLGVALLGTTIWLLWPAKKTLAPSVNTTNNVVSNLDVNIDTPVQTSANMIDFSTADLPDREPVFDFTTTIPKTWRAEYLSVPKAINFYDSSLSGLSLATSQMFVSHYTAAAIAKYQYIDGTVEGTITKDNLPVVEYERPAVTTKLPAGYPNWWTKQHKVVEIQTGSARPYTFFVYDFAPSITWMQTGEVLQNIHF